MPFRLSAYKKTAHLGLKLRAVCQPSMTSGFRNTHSPTRIRNQIRTETSAKLKYSYILNASKFFVGFYTVYLIDPRSSYSFLSTLLMPSSLSFVVDKAFFLLQHGKNVCSPMSEMRSQIQARMRHKIKAGRAKPIQEAKVIPVLCPG